MTRSLYVPSDVAWSRLRPHWPAKTVEKESGYDWATPVSSVSAAGLCLSQFDFRTARGNLYALVVGFAVRAQRADRIKQRINEFRIGEYRRELKRNMKRPRRTVHSPRCNPHFGCTIWVGLEGDRVPYIQ